MSNYHDYEDFSSFDWDEKFKKRVEKRKKDSTILKCPNCNKEKIVYPDPNIFNIGEIGVIEASCDECDSKLKEHAILWSPEGDLL